MITKDKTRLHVELGGGCCAVLTGVKVDTFLQSCGVADLVTTCYSGRNRKVAEAFAACKNANKVTTGLVHCCAVLTI